LPSAGLRALALLPPRLPDARRVANSVSSPARARPRRGARESPSPRRAPRDGNDSAEPLGAGSADDLCARRSAGRERLRPLLQHSAKLFQLTLAAKFAASPRRRAALSEAKALATRRATRIGC
jgi:hypothetical protein